MYAIRINWFSFGFFSGFGFMLINYSVGFMFFGVVEKYDNRFNASFLIRDFWSFAYFSINKMRLCFYLITTIFLYLIFNYNIF